MLPDHFSGDFGALVGATAAACATRDLRIGTSVLANDFRHPAVLAKEVATLDVVSSGRVELGLGTGWMRADYERTGLRFDRPGIRIERLAEAIAVLKGLFSGKRVDFSGAHYRIRGLEGGPLPVQRPHPPLLIGGGGQRLLSLAAREADIVGLNPAARSGVHDDATDLDGTADATDVKLQWLRDAAGDRWDQVEVCMQSYALAITDNAAKIEHVLSARYSMPLEQAREVPYALTGSVEAICDTLEARRERWCVSYWIIPYADIEAFAPVVERLAGH